jgi:hypothetical protein
MKTIRARFSGGVIEPLEEVDIEEGKEILVTIMETSISIGDGDPLDVSFGGWKDLIDCDELKRNIYADRLISTRPEVRL